MGKMQMMKLDHYATNINIAIVLMFNQIPGNKPGRSLMQGRIL